MPQCGIRWKWNRRKSSNLLQCFHKKYNVKYNDDICSVSDWEMRVDWCWTFENLFKWQNWTKKILFISCSLDRPGRVWQLKIFYVTVYFLILIVYMQKKVIIMSLRDNENFLLDKKTIIYSWNWIFIGSRKISY